MYTDVVLYNSKSRFLTPIGEVVISCGHVVIRPFFEPEDGPLKRRGGVIK